MINKKHWQAALDVQTACNLSGVVRSFAEAMVAISEEAHRLGKGTDWKNTHPICVLFSTQVGHLTKTSTLAEESVYSAAYQKVAKVVEIEKKISDLHYDCDHWIADLESERDSILLAVECS